MADSTLRADRRSLRRELRAARRAIGARESEVAAAAIWRHIRSLPAFRRARRVAVFLAFDGEPDLAPFLDEAVRLRKTLYVPMLKKSKMTFAPLGSNEPLAPNFFGILEPRSHERIDPRDLDLVLTPLVAFDSHGTRIGVGRGYYDRAFHFLRHRASWRKPKLLGVGYELQYVPYLEEREWDVPLWGAVTEEGVRRFIRSPSV